MTRVRRWFLILLALGLCPLAVRAASFAENRDYKALTSAFRDLVWWRAEELSAQFCTNYPKSDRVSEVVLLEAEAQYCQATNQLGRGEIADAGRKFSQAIALLSARKDDAGALADQYVYWLGVAQFGNTNYPAAAETFAGLMRQFPASPRLLDAAVGEAEARARLGQWSRVVAALQDTNGIFQSLASATPASDSVVRGRLLLAEAQLVQTNAAASEAALRPLEGLRLSPEQDWERTYRLCRAQLAAGAADDSLANSSNLLALAERAGRWDLRAESTAFQAGVMEQLNRRDDAIDIWSGNLVTNAPPQRQSEALLRVTALLLAQNRPAEAGQMLEKYLAQAPPPAAADVALLTLGELHLNRYLASAGTNALTSSTTNAAADTNELQQALGCFTRLTTEFPNSPRVGKAQLDRGWCFWAADRIPDSLTAFRAAADHLGTAAAEDLAVARFKIGDALYRQGDYAGAAQNYRAVVDDFTQSPRVQAALVNQALYQLLQTSIQLKDMAGASHAMERLLKANPADPLAARSLLLVGQGFEDFQDPAQARQNYEKFIELWPDSPLRAQVELDIARTHEQQSKWEDAIADYDNWLSRFPTNALRPNAEFYRALANFHARHETNALAQMTNFVAQYTNSDLAPQAQWWIGDYYYQLRDFVKAEKSYRTLFQTWPKSELADKSRLMAGLAAVGWTGYDEATNYFTMLTSNTNTPPELMAKAKFLYGDALVLRSAGGTNKLADLNLAIQVFLTIPQSVTNEQAAQAWGKIGNCYFQMAAAAATNSAYYASASNYFQRVITNAYADVTSRSQAQVGLGHVCARQADGAPPEESASLLRQAMADYLDVFYERNLREGERPDLFWKRNAGEEAAQLAENLQEWQQAVRLYEELKACLPFEVPSLKDKSVKAQEHLNQKRN